MAGNGGPGAFKQTFEKIDKATGGVAGGIKDAAAETVKQVASTPIDALKTLIGNPDSGIEDPSTGGSSGQTQTQGGLGAGMPSAFQEKIQVDRDKKNALLRQHRMVLQKYDQHFKQKKAEEEQQEQMKAQQKKQEKEQQIALEQQKKQNPFMKAFKQSRAAGKGETGKKKN